MPIVLLLGQIELLVDHGWTLASKALAEIAAIVVLGAALAMGVARWVLLRHSFLAWLSALTGCFLLREINLDGTSTLLYLAMLGLLLLGWRRYTWFADYLAGRITLTLLAGVFFTYFVSQGCDKNLWAFVTDNRPLLEHAEEFIELAGHLMVLLLILLCRPVSNPLTSPARQGVAVAASAVR